MLQVYATMSPVVHVVNIASGTTDSQANITVWATYMIFLLHNSS